MRRERLTGRLANDSHASRQDDMARKEKNEQNSIACFSPIPNPPITRTSTKDNGRPCKKSLAVSDLFMPLK
jgi:hypothetical protein